MGQPVVGRVDLRRARNVFLPTWRKDIVSAGSAALAGDHGSTTTTNHARSDWFAINFAFDALGKTGHDEQQCLAAPNYTRVASTEWQVSREGE
jgi:hypothetical protein